MKKHFFLSLLTVLLVVLPLAVWADCQCVQPNETQIGFEQPTCTKPGYFVLQCRDCGGVFISKSGKHPALGHNWDAVSALGATCDSPMTVTYQCTRCGEKKTEKEGSALGHIWSQTYYEPATCAADGYRSFKCANCSETKIETLPATGKCNWGDWILVEESTCLQDGLKISECSTCGDTMRQILPAEGAHDYRTISSKAATCTENGSKTYECSRCGKKKTETLKASGHKWKDQRVITEATCTQEGQAESVCTVCGKSETRTLEKQEHRWNAWRITQEATRKEEGLKERTCRLCGRKQTQKISASSKSQADPDSLEGLNVFTTAGSVNLRKGAGKQHRRTGVAEKKNTCLGMLLEAALDKQGIVWYKVDYKNKECWVMGTFAEVRIGILDLEKERQPSGKKKTELTGYFLKSFEPAADMLGLKESEAEQGASFQWQNDAVMIAGFDYVEYILLKDKGYTLFGIKVGDKISNASKTLKGKDLLLTGKSSDTYTYRLPCSPDSLSVDGDGFDATLEITVGSDQRIEQIQLKADVFLNE